MKLFISYIKYHTKSIIHYVIYLLFYKKLELISTYLHIRINIKRVKIFSFLRAFFYLICTNENSVAKMFWIDCVENAYSVAETHDKGFIAAGYTSSNDGVFKKLSWKP